jgi:hypothetical protein
MFEKQKALDRKVPYKKYTLILITKSLCIHSLILYFQHFDSYNLTLLIICIPQEGFLIVCFLNWPALV